MNNYGATGLAVGFGEGLRNARRRKLEDEDRAVATEERARRREREDSAATRDAARFDRERAQWSQQDADRDRKVADEMDQDSLAIADRAHELKTRKRDELEHDQDRTHTLATRELGLSETKKAIGRKDHEWAQSQQAASAKMREEGMERLLDALDKGVDPQLIEQEFNASGQFKIKPGSLQYDPATGNVKLTGPGGGQYDGPIDQLRALFTQPAPLVKLDENDRLVDPRSRKEVIGPASGGGRSITGVTKWNRQQASDKAADAVRNGLGLKYDNDLQQFMIPEGMSEKVSYGASLAGQVTREFGERISPEEAGDIALQVMRLVPSAQQARQQAQQKGKVKEDEIADEAARIMRAGRIRAAQELATLMQDKETELQQREQMQDENGLNGASPPSPAAQPAATGSRPPLDSFNQR